MTMRDYGLWASAFMILVGLTMIIIMLVERQQAARKVARREWLESEEEGLARVTWGDPGSDPLGDVLAATRLPMLDGQEPTR